MNAKLLSSALLTWYAREKRELPWRGLKDPYRIWLSEVILQQTQVVQGTPYYHAFVERFPEVKDLAAADLDEVLKVWEGLGYYSRGRNLHKAARIVAEEHDGVFPSDYEGLLGLPGVGPYTAAAIASICYDERVPVVDGNVNRAISRVYDVAEAVDTNKGRNLIWALMNEAIQYVNSAGDFNQAVMEFGAGCCTPKAPKCENCPIADNCLALARKTISERPVKKGKTKVKDRYLDYHVIRHDEHTYIRKRSGKGIWEGLYEFVLKELSEKPDAPAVALAGCTIESIAEYKHVLSHQRLHVRFVIQSGQPSQEISQDYERVPMAEIRDYPMARLSTRFLEQEGLALLGG